MRVVEMDPREEGARVVVLQPGDGAIDSDVAAPLRFERVRVTGGVARNVVVVEIESDRKSVV